MSGDACGLIPKFNVTIFKRLRPLLKKIKVFIDLM